MVGMTDHVPESTVADPLDVFSAAREGRRVTVQVSPEHRDGSISFQGEVADRRKIGSGGGRSVTIHVMVDGEIAGMEIEATMGRDGWDAFRAFHYTHGETLERGVESWFRYVGKVTGLDITPGGAESAEDAREVAP